MTDDPTVLVDEADELTLGTRLLSGAPSMAPRDPDNLDPVEEELRVRMCAAQLGCRPCPHVAAVPDQPHSVDLRERKALCRSCAPTFGPPPPHPLGLCDLCGSQSGEFEPRHIHVGSAVLVGRLGECCTRLIAQVTDR